MLKELLGAFGARDLWTLKYKQHKLLFESETEKSGSAGGVKCSAHIRQCTRESQQPAADNDLMNRMNNRRNIGVLVCSL